MSNPIPEVPFSLPRTTLKCATLDMGKMNLLTRDGHFVYAVVVLTSGDITLTTINLNPTAEIWKTAETHAFVPRVTGKTYFYYPMENAFAVSLYSSSEKHNFGDDISEVKCIRTVLKEDMMSVTPGKVVGVINTSSTNENMWQN